MENQIASAACNCIKQVIIKNGKAIIVPDFTLLSNPPYTSTPLEGCFCPRTADELGKCLTGCLGNVLTENNKHISEITLAVIIDSEGNEIPIKFK